MIREGIAQKHFYKQKLFRFAFSIVVLMFVRLQKVQMFFVFVHIRENSIVFAMPIKFCDQLDLAS